MPVIFTFRNLKVIAYLRDHLPPHVHVVGPGFEVVVRLDTFETTSKSAPPKVQRLAAELVQKNVHICWERWNEIHGED